MKSRGGEEEEAEEPACHFSAFHEAVHLDDAGCLASVQPAEALPKRRQCATIYPSTVSCLGLRSQKPPRSRWRGGVHQCVTPAASRRRILHLTAAGGLPSPLPFPQWLACKRPSETHTTPSTSRGLMPPLANGHSHLFSDVGCLCGHAATPSLACPLRCRAFARPDIAGQCVQQSLLI
jgi:hypothetical protein